ncbi:MAG: hypothetical protein ACREXX_19140 [Gammaproteobacteria bacterium]
MNDTSGFTEMPPLSMRLQRQPWEGWAVAGTRGPNDSSEYGPRHPFEIGEEMLSSCLALQRVMP